PAILEKLTQPPVVIEDSKAGGGDPIAPAGKIIGAKTLTVKFNKPMVTTEYEAEEYAAALKAAIIAELKKGNRIQV
ncbi:MAG TPA: hypothetical protein PLY87_15975, partial [Planctomycetaceae bacterium]|nr:hypothetical protein [Planctomycetaceae bacterium]